VETVSRRHALAEARAQLAAAVTRARHLGLDGEALRQAVERLLVDKTRGEADGDA
jgi:hypothetical protein